MPATKDLWTPEILRFGAAWVIIAWTGGEIMPLPSSSGGCRWLQMRLRGGRVRPCGDAQPDLYLTTATCRQLCSGLLSAWSTLLNVFSHHPWFLKYIFLCLLLEKKKMRTFLKGHQKQHNNKAFGSTKKPGSWRGRGKWDGKWGCLSDTVWPRCSAPSSQQEQDPDHHEGKPSWRIKRLLFFQITLRPSRLTWAHTLHLVIHS